MSNRLYRAVSVAGLLAFSTLLGVAISTDANAEEGVVQMIKDEDLSKMKELMKDDRKIVPFLKDDGMKATVAKEMAIQRITKDEQLMKMMSEKMGDGKTMAAIRTAAADTKAMAAMRDGMLKYDSALKTMIQELMARNMVMSNDGASKPDDKSRLKDMKETMLAREALALALQDDGMKTAIAKEMMIQQMMKDPELMKMITGRMSDSKMQTAMKASVPDSKSVLTKDTLLKATQEMIARRMLTEGAAKN